MCEMQFRSPIRRELLDSVCLLVTSGIGLGAGILAIMESQPHAGFFGGTHQRDG